MIALDQVSALVLVGGRGRRIQAADGAPVEKGLLTLHDKPLVAWAVSALPSGLARIYISANRSSADYARYGVVLADDPAFGPDPGPLAGVAAALSVIKTPWLLVAPADVPRPPCTLSQRLLHYASVSSACRLVYVRASRPQPLFMLVHVSLLDGLRRYLLEGGRQVLQWQSTNGQAVQVQGGNNDFFNINTQEDLCRAHQLISPLRA